MGVCHGLEVSTRYILLDIDNMLCCVFADDVVAFSFYSYAMQWLVVLPLEIVAASITVDYWVCVLQLRRLKWLEGTASLTDTNRSKTSR